MAEKMRLTILSFACCNPGLATHDKEYALRLKEAAEKVGVNAEIDLVHVTDALMSGHYAYMSPIVPLFKKYGAAVTPALFINQKLVLYGGVPTIEKLMDAIKDALKENEKGKEG